MKKLNPLITGTLLLTITGIITRFLGFIYRIYLSRLIGAEGMGIYQLIFPVFAICFSLCCGPMQTAISKFTAEANNSQYHIGIQYYKIGLLLSLSAACICASSIYYFSAPIAHYFLLEDRCNNLLKILAFSIPFNAIHSCICGYYYGKKSTFIPAAAQLIEQVLRMFFVWILAIELSKKGQSFNLETAVIVLVIGEAASMIFTFTAIHIHTFIQKRQASPNSVMLQKRQIASNLLSMALPLTASRLTLSILQSIEATMIPAKLQLFGLAASNAFSIYGIFSGMALPFILFPNALTNSFAVVLLPDIAQAQAHNQNKHISNMTNRVRDYCLYLGILCTGTFLTLGPQIGTLFFANATAGTYIAALSWICPFLYLTTTFASILNGLGKTTTTFIHQLIGLTVRLLFVLFCIPLCGILGYFLGLLASQLLTCVLHYSSLKHIITLQMNAFHILIRPMFAIFLSIATEKIILSHMLIFHSSFILFIISCSIIIGIYFIILHLTRKEKDFI